MLLDQLSASAEQEGVYIANGGSGCDESEGDVTACPALQAAGSLLSNSRLRSPEAASALYPLYVSVLFPLLIGWALHFPRSRTTKPDPLTKLYSYAVRVPPCSYSY